MLSTGAKSFDCENQPRSFDSENRTRSFDSEDGEESSRGVASGGRKRQHRGRRGAAYGASRQRSAMSNARQSQLGLIARLFAEADASGTGDLDLKELGWVMQQLGIQMNHEQLHAVFGALDVDDSGAVTQANFVEWWETKNGSGGTDDESRARALEAFNTIDVDGGGTIDAGELSVLAERMGLGLSEAELANAVKEMDADNSGEIDFEEFFRWYTSGGESSSSVALGLGLGLGLGATKDGEQLFEVTQDDDSEDEFDAAAAAHDMFNDLMAASLGGSKELLGLSLGMFPPDNAFRVLISKLVPPPCEIYGMDAYMFCIQF